MSDQPDQVDGEPAEDDPTEAEVVVPPDAPPGVQPSATGVVAAPTHDDTPDEDT